MVKTESEIILSKEQILTDFKTGWISRFLSVKGRKEVLTGKAKFGVFGDGKELPQLAMAHFFNNGDWRSGYYRDQTFMLAADMLTPTEFFYQLYGITDIDKHPASAGRSFNNHFASRFIDEQGNWGNVAETKNCAADISPTAGQMPRLLGLGLASKLFKNNKALKAYPHLSNNGSEITWGTIGDGSTSEGHFFEIINAAGVIQIPLIMSVWDDEYAISVEKDKQTIKASISEALKGFQKTGKSNGLLIYKVKGWDYPALLKTYKEASERCRKEHVPVLIHVDELTQLTGHSTSGSHERYKSKERLDWEADFDGLKKMELWMLDNKICSANTIAKIKAEAEDIVNKAIKQAWQDCRIPVENQKKQLLAILENKSCQCSKEGIDKIAIITRNLKNNRKPLKKDITQAARKLMREVCPDCPTRTYLQKNITKWLAANTAENYNSYSSKLFSENPKSTLLVEGLAPEYSDEAVEIAGREIIKDNFDKLFEKNPLLVAFGEDVGKIGGVNQTYEGLQAKYGEQRIFDTGLRETSIIGKGVGLAMRGLRPVAEIQYLDYLLYGLQTLSDDISTLHWRTVGGQSAPLIVSTRGHRLEGIWHAGSPMSLLLGSLRGVHLCVPRNMTQAAGFYNTLLEGNDPAVVIEPLNAYRLKEKKPDNFGEFRIPLGEPEVMVKGKDVTLVTYGSTVRIAIEAAKQLREHNVSLEVIDVQTLMPFDIRDTIVESLKRTHKIVFFDEDVPGGATAYMMQKVIEAQKGFRYLEMAPVTFGGREHRPAYSSDGDYYSNPNAENVFEVVYNMMHEHKPDVYPRIF